MKVLFDIVHPADVLFFKRPLEILQQRGDAVLILSRHKDVTCDLLNELGLAHRPISRAGEGMFGLAVEFLHRDWGVFQAARKFRPDVMVGFGGVAISHVGRLLSIPAISFYDSENATLQNRMTWPFISRLYVPACYQGPVPKGRTTRIPGTKELSYLHPSAFVPDQQLAVELGLDPEVDNFFVRVVAWRANHDFGKTGWPEEVLRSVVEKLSRLGKVHLSAEIPLGAAFSPYLVSGPKTKIHHLMAFSRLLVGESATMASEAAMLGVPAIYAARDFPGYTQDLEAAGLLVNISEISTNALFAAIDKMLERPQSTTTNLRNQYVSRCADWAEVVLEAIDEHGARQPRTRQA